MNKESTNSLTSPSFEGPFGIERYFAWPCCFVHGPVEITSRGRLPVHWKDALKGSLPEGHPLHSWADRLPGELRKLLCQLPAYSYEIMRYACFHEDRIVYLLKHCPVVLFLIAEKLAAEPHVEDYVAAKIPLKALHKIVEWLQFPGYSEEAFSSKHIAKMLCRLPIGFCHPDAIVLFRKACERKVVRRALSHYKGKFTIDILQCLQLPDELIRPAIFAASEKGPIALEPMLQQWCRLCDLAGISYKAKKPFPSDTFAWAKAIGKFQRQLISDGLLPSRDWSYGPPAPPGFEKITSVEEVLLVSDTAEVCLSNYQGDLAQGHRVAYWNSIQGIVVLLQLDRHGMYALEAITGFGNSLVEPEVDYEVTQFFIQRRKVSLNGRA